MATESKTSPSPLERKVKAIYGPQISSTKQYGNILARINAAVKLGSELLPPKYFPKLMLDEVDERESIENKRLAALNLPTNLKLPEAPCDLELVKPYWQCCNTLAQALCNQSKEVDLFGRYSSITPVLDMTLKPIKGRLLIELAQQVQVSQADGKSIFAKSTINSATPKELFNLVIAHIKTALKKVSLEEREDINMEFDDTHVDPHQQLINLLLAIPNELYFRFQNSKTLAQGSGNYIGLFGDFIMVLVLKLIESNDKIQRIVNDLPEVVPMASSSEVSFPTAKFPSLSTSNVASSSIFFLLSPLRRSLDTSVKKSHSVDAQSSSFIHSSVESSAQLGTLISCLGEQDWNITFAYLITHTYELISGLAGIRNSIISNVVIHTNQSTEPTTATQPIDISSMPTSQKTAAAAASESSTLATSPRWNQSDSDDSLKSATNFSSPSLATVVDGKIVSEETIHRVTWQPDIEEELEVHVKNFIDCLEKLIKRVYLLSLCAQVHHQFGSMSGDDAQVSALLQARQDIVSLREKLSMIDTPSAASAATPLPKAPTPKIGSPR